MNSFSFIVLGDLHYATYNNPDFAAARDRVFEAFFRQVAARKADLVFAIGDTTNRGTIAELEGQEEIARRCGLEIIRLTGNHDTDSLEKVKLAPFFLGKYPAVTPLNSSDFELYTAFDFGSARFILLDSSRVMCSAQDWSGFVSPAQLGWLGEEIEAYNRSEQNALIVMGHHPMRDTTSRSEEDAMNIDNSAEVRAEFQRLQRPPALYICGHNHSNSITGPDDSGWIYFQAGAPYVCESYREVKVGPDGIDIMTPDFDLSEPALRADFETARHNFPDHFELFALEEVAGSDVDRRRFISTSTVGSAAGKGSRSGL